MDDKNKIFSWIFYLAVMAVLVLLVLQRVHDTDVWLHLGIGKYIIEHRALPPQGDIFTYTSYGKPYEYYEWLFQAGLYLLYRFFDYHGLMFFKLALWLLTLGFLWRWMRTERVGPRVAAFTLVLSAYWLCSRWKERPEIMGYFFLAFYLWTWAEYRHGERNYWYFLPWIQILWINLHASALLGIVILLAILVGEGLDFLWHKNNSSLRVVKALAVTIPLLVASSFINPYGYKLLIYPFTYSTEMAQQKLVIEWISINRVPTYHYQYLAFLIPAALTFIPRCFRPKENLHPADLMLFAFSGLLPYISLRYVMVFALIGLPLAGKNIAWFCSRSTKIQNWLNREGQKLLIAQAVEAVALAVLLLGTIFLYKFFLGRHGGWGLQDYTVPPKAVNFIMQNRIPGPVFNQYEWGGYLILEAYPSYLPYLDSRIFDIHPFTEYQQILQAQSGWEGILARRKVNLLLIRSLFPLNGSLVPLIPELIKSPDWRLIWSREATLVFLKNTPENQFWTQKFTLSKSQIYQEVVEEGKFLVKDFKVNQFTYSSIGWAYLNLGQFKEAKKAYEEHLKLNPQDQAARNYLDFLRKQGYGK